MVILTVTSIGRWLHSGDLYVGFILRYWHYWNHKQVLVEVENLLLALAVQNARNSKEGCQWQHIALLSWLSKVSWLL